MNNNDKCRSNNNSPRAVMIHGVPVKTYNALQNHIIVLLDYKSYGKFEKSQTILDKNPM